VDNSLFEKIPRRIGDKDGNAGDMVNFLILGDEEQMKKVFTNAGWVKVDSDVKETVLAGFHCQYVEGIVSDDADEPLYLFGRPQDYGWGACRADYGGGFAESFAGVEGAVHGEWPHSLGWRGEA